MLLLEVAVKGQMERAPASALHLRRHWVVAAVGFTMAAPAVQVGPVRREVDLEDVQLRHVPDQQVALLGRAAGAVGAHQTATMRREAVAVQVGVAGRATE